MSFLCTLLDATPLTRKSGGKFQLFGQNIRKVNRQDVNGKTFQIHLKQVISRFLELFDHLEKVLE